MIVIVWQSWWTLVVLGFAILSAVLAQVQMWKHLRRRRALGNAIYRLPSGRPDGPKVTVHIEGEEPFRTQFWREDL